MKTAQECRDMVYSLRQNNINDQLATIRATIEDAARNGKLSITLDGHNNFTWAAKNELEYDGFKVTYTGGWFNPKQTKVSWAPEVVEAR